MLVTGVATWCLVESVEWTNSNKNIFYQYSIHSIDSKYQCTLGYVASYTVLSMFLRKVITSLVSMPLNPRHDDVD
jgi:hypothetical protein